MFFALLLLILPAPAFAGGGVLNILYTGARNGELEPCGCSPQNEFGGLARQSGYIAANRGSITPFILVDAGGSMPPDSPQGRLKAEAIVRSYAIMGYDAAALFKKDALMPADFLSPLIKGEKTPFLSGGGRVAVERGGIKINVSADPKARKDGALNVLLTDKAVDELKALEGWDVIITSSGEILDGPQRSGGGVIVAGYPRGQKLGVLTVSLDGPGPAAAFSHRWQLLGADVKDDPRVRGVLNEYDAKVAGLLKDEERKASERPPYIGVAACSECHRPFVESWRTMKHSASFAALEKAGKSRDPECVRCHTTGFMEEGYYSMTSTPGLANVQCEACHGPGREHAADTSKPMRAVDEPVCGKCHTPERSPDFDFKSYHERILHR